MSYLKELVIGGGNGLGLVLENDSGKIMMKMLNSNMDVIESGTS